MSRFFSGLIAGIALATCLAVSSQDRSGAITGGSAMQKIEKRIAKTPQLPQVQSSEQQEVPTITIIGPISSIPPGAEVVLPVSGLSDLTTASISSSPKTGVTLDYGKKSSGQPFVSFTSTQIAIHTVTVAISLPRPGWLDSIDQGLAGATQSDLPDQLLLEEFKKLAGKLTTASTTRSASCKVQVGQSPVVVVPPTPPTPPTPVPPDPLAEGVVFVVVIRQSTISIQDIGVLIDLRDWTDTQPKDKIANFEYEPKDRNNPAVAGYIAKIPAGETLPYYFILQTKAGDKAKILYHGRLPDNAEEIISMLKRFSGVSSPVTPRAVRPLQAAA